MAQAGEQKPKTLPQNGAPWRNSLPAAAAAKQSKVELLPELPSAVPVAEDDQLQGGKSATG